MAGNGVSADNLVKSAQISLNYLGYDAGAADNAYGKRTKQALEQFYRDIGGEFDGELDIIELLQLQNPKLYHCISTHALDPIDCNKGWSRR
jgi:peptidoglycan hydrolase-like protein with peptidoglycan-binding domain